jgi:hypothetical protein
MRKLLAGIVAACALVVGYSTPAVAITGDYVEDFEHPYVGLVVFYDESGVFMHRCSGSLLTPTVFLTAGHCTAGATRARVYFQQDAGANFDPITEVDPVSGYPETCAPGTLGTLCATSNELYDFDFNDFADFPNTRDVGIVILDQRILLAEYGSLATAGSLDGLATGPERHEVTFTASGYGHTEVNPVHLTSFRERLMAESRLTNLDNALTDGYNLQTNGNGNGRGGTCSGDSGGPVFYGNFPSNTIVAVTSFGLSPWCRGVDFSFRTDTVAVINWIMSVVGPDRFALIDFVDI